MISLFSLGTPLKGVQQEMQMYSLGSLTALPEFLICLRCAFIEQRVSLHLISRHRRRGCSHIQRAVAPTCSIVRRNRLSTGDRFSPSHRYRAVLSTSQSSDSRRIVTQSLGETTPLVELAKIYHAPKARAMRSRTQFTSHSFAPTPLNVTV